MTDFEPPKGYQESKLKANPKGKQLWLVQLPPKFDISQIKSLNVDGTFKVDGKKFTLDDTHQSRNVNALIPKGDGLKVGKKVDKTFTLRQSFEIPEIDYDKVIVEKPVVKQKKNLRMRYYPTGTGPTSDELADEVSEPSPKRSKSSHDKDESTPKKHKKEKKEKKDKKKKKSKD